MTREPSPCHLFLYYSFSVEIDGERLNLLLNVGKAINDGSYHIYDITKNKKRRTANQSPTGLSRVEKTDAMKNSSSINSISENDKNVNSITNNILTGDKGTVLLSPIVKIKNRSAQQAREQTALIAGRYRKEPSIVREVQASSKAETIAAEHDNAQL